MFEVLKTEMLPVYIVTRDFMDKASLMIDMCLARRAEEARLHGAYVPRFMEEAVANADRLSRISVRLIER